MTMTTVGYGDLTPQNYIESLYCIVAMIISGGFFAYTVGTMCTLVEGLNRKQTNFETRMDAVNEYMRLKFVPDYFQRRVRRYMFYRRESDKTADELEVLNQFSNTLQGDLLLIIYKERLEKIRFFRHAPDPFIIEACKFLQVAISAPNDILIDEVNINDTMYLINRGAVQTEYHTASELDFGAILQQDAFIGWRALMSEGAVGEATYRAITFCEMLRLHGYRLRDLLKHYPVARRLAYKTIIRELWRRVIRAQLLQKAAEQVRRQRTRSAIRKHKDPAEEKAPGTGKGGEVANSGANGAAEGTQTMNSTLGSTTKDGSEKEDGGKGEEVNKEEGMARPRSPISIPEELPRGRLPPIIDESSTLVHAEGPPGASGSIVKVSKTSSAPTTPLARVRGLHTRGLTGTPLAIDELEMSNLHQRMERVEQNQVELVSLVREMKLQLNEVRQQGTRLANSVAMRGRRGINT